MSHLEVLLQWLREVGDLQPVEEGVFTVSRFQHSGLPRPLTIRVTHDSLEQYLLAAAPMSRGAFPESEPVVAALRLLIVHLTEILDRDGETGWITIGPDEVDAPVIRRDRAFEWLADPGDDPVPGDYRWTAAPRG